MITTEWCVETSDFFSAKLLDMTQQPSHTEPYKIQLTFICDVSSVSLSFPVNPWPLANGVSQDRNIPIRNLDHHMGMLKLAGHCTWIKFKNDLLTQPLHTEAKWVRVDHLWDSQ